ncbi:MAG: calcium/sodium antiporter [Romboutsia sp.]|nr:calcium/sodium antiporter [Romboutsia sp.]
MFFLTLIIGFVLLIKGADLFVEGSVSIAKYFNVPAMIIGLTIVALGTSAPEASVSITSSLAGQNEMSIANVVGSNFFNILLVLGVSSIIKTLPVKINTVKKDTPFLILISILLLIFSYNLKLSRFEGFIFLVIFTYFLFDTIKSSKKSISEINSNESNDSNNKPQSVLKTIIISIIGLVGIVFGGDMVVNSASSIATIFGMSENLIGLTIVAMGTSLPEFVTSIVAVKKGETEIAIGNVIGSNIFNILFVLGISTVIAPLTVSMASLIDIIFMILITLILFFMINKKHNLNKANGILMVLMYVIYMIYTIFR